MLFLPLLKKAAMVSWTRTRTEDGTVFRGVSTQGSGHACLPGAETQQLQATQILRMSGQLPGMIPEIFLQDCGVVLRLDPANSHSLLEFSGMVVIMLEWLLHENLRNSSSAKLLRSPCAESLRLAPSWFGATQQNPALGRNLGS